MKIIDRGGFSNPTLSNYWFRLFVFNRDELERAVFHIEADKSNQSFFCFRLQIGGDSLADISLHLGRLGLSTGIWSV